MTREPVPDEATACAWEIDRLAKFLLDNYADEIGRGDPAGGESAGTVAIRLLSIPAVAGAIRGIREHEQRVAVPWFADAHEHEEPAPERDIERNLVDILGAALYLGSTEGHVRRLASERRLAFVRVGGKVRFDVADLEAFVAAGRVEPTP